MKILLVLLLFLCTPVFAAPFVVADVTDPKADTCVWDGTGFGPLVNAVVVDAVRGAVATANRICLRDVAGALVGSNNISIMSRDSTNVWGDSVIVPFTFARSAPGAAPTGMRVAR